MNHQFKSACHPEANGRRPHHDDEQFTFTFPVEDGSQLIIRLGRAGMAAHAAMILAMLKDDPDLDAEVKAIVPDQEGEIPCQPWPGGH